MLPNNTVQDVLFLSEYILRKGHANEWKLGDTAVNKQHSDLMSWSRYMPVWSFSRNLCFFYWVWNPHLMTAALTAIVFYEPIMDLQGQVCSWLSLSCCTSGQIFLDLPFYSKHQASIPYPSQNLHMSMHITHTISWSERIRLLRSPRNSRCNVDVKWLHSACRTYDWPAMNKL